MPSNSACCYIFHKVYGALSTIYTDVFPFVALQNKILTTVVSFDSINKSLLLFNKSLLLHSKRSEVESYYFDFTIVREYPFDRNTPLKKYWRVSLRVDFVHPYMGVGRVWVFLLPSIVL
jgi:hypothetical protein